MYINLHLNVLAWNCSFKTTHFYVFWYPMSISFAEKGYLFTFPPNCSFFKKRNISSGEAYNKPINNDNNLFSIQPWQILSFFAIFVSTFLFFLDFFFTFPSFFVPLLYSLSPLFSLSLSFFPFSFWKMQNMAQLLLPSLGSHHHPHLLKCPAH